MFGAEFLSRTGHRFPPPSPQRDRQKEEEGSEVQEFEADPRDEAGAEEDNGLTMNAAHQRNYSRLKQQQEDEERRLELERARALAAIDAGGKTSKKKPKEDVWAKRRQREEARKKRKAEKLAAAAAARRNAEAVKKERERLRLEKYLQEIDAKTKRSFKVTGDVRPDGRVRDSERKELPFLYFGDFRSVGKERAEELARRWAPVADPPDYFWEPNGFGEFRKHAAEDPFFVGHVAQGQLAGPGVLRFENDDTYHGSFLNDAPHGVGRFSTDVTDASDGSTARSHRLAVFQRGRFICFLSELCPGTRIKLFGRRHGNFDRCVTFFSTLHDRSTRPPLPSALT